MLADMDKPVLLLDLKGESLWPRSPAAFYLPKPLESGVPQALNGYLFLKLEGGPCLATAEGPQAEDLLKLIALNIDLLKQLEPPEEDVQGAMRRLLCEALPAIEQEALLDGHSIPRSLQRCVMLLELKPRDGQSACQQLQELLPLGEQDILTDIDPSRAALIKSLEGGLGAEGAEEYALALQETYREETGHDLTISIGEGYANIEGLKQSYEQARRALDIAPRYPDKRGLYVWRRMLLPRFLSELPRDMAERYHSLLFNKKTASLFTQEMLQTVDMFLEKDLNLSDTARQLYIHRNTLVYRLDKVQRLSGLDLRRFEDAFLFKLLFSLKPGLPKNAPRPLDR